jgi:hypothetical protein
MMRGQSVINLSLASKLGPNCGRQVNEELNEAWLQDCENWKKVKRENLRKSLKGFWALSIKYAIVLTLGIFIGIMSQLSISILATIFYILTIAICSVLFVFIFHHSDKELSQENPPLPERYIWENGELKVESPKE